MKKSLSFIIICLMAVTATAQNIHVGSFYVTTPTDEKLFGDGNNNWTTRQTHICNLFKFERPDILSLQGATEAQMKTIRSGMNSGMTGVASYNLAGDIIYNNTVTFDTCGVVTDMPEGSVATWAKFQKDEKTFFVFNVNFSSEGTLSTTSTTRLIAAIGEINPDKLPVFITGLIGCNENAPRSAYTRLSSRYYDSYTTSSAVSAEYGTVNNFDIEANHGTDRYDFIFHSKSIITPKAYGQLESGYFTKEADGSYKRRMLSTHFPIMVKATIN